MAIKKRKISLLLQDLTLLEKYSEDLFDFSPLPTLLSSPLSIILEFNPSFEDISGFRLDEIVGKPIHVLFGKKTTKDLVYEATQKGKVENKEVFLFSKNKEKIPVSVFIKARIFEDETAGFFLSVFDLRKVKKMEERLRESISGLELMVQKQKEKLQKFSVILEKKIEERKKELEEKIEQLERIRKEAVERELEMVNLKKENKYLEEEILKLKTLNLNG